MIEPTAAGAADSGLRGRNVLITGGLGFIGSNLARRCLDLGAKVTLYDCLDPRSGGNMFNVHDIEGQIEIVLNDIRNFEGISAAVRKQDVLFSCAAYTSHPNSMTDPIVDIEVNCKGVMHVLEAARRFNPAMKIVHVGTSTQIGRMQRSPVDELHPEFPLDIYSANKSASEKYVLIYGSYYGLRTSVVRLANVFGPRSNIRTPDFGFMNYFIGLALQGKELTVFGDGAQLRNVSYVDDCVEALLRAAVSSAADGQVFFGSADRQHSIADIAAAITTHIGGSIRRVEWPKARAALEIGDAVIDNSKIKRMLHWQPCFGLDEGLKRTAAYFRPALTKYL
jgi:UDP-glucose 4-epimerase